MEARSPMTTTHQHSQQPQIPEPESSTTALQLPAAVTFFMSRGQRRDLLRALRTVSADRTHALLSIIAEHQTREPS